MMERRRCQRIKPSYRITAIVRGTDRAHIIDLSPHGAKLETEVPLAQSSLCPMTLSMAAVDLRLRGVVRSCSMVVDRPGHRLAFSTGLEFVNLGPRQRALLEDAIAVFCLIEVAANRPSSTARHGHPRAHRDLVLA